METHSEIALASRKKVLELVYKAQTSHIGSLFGCADLMAVLFEHIDLDKDKFILSAGWKACMLYYHLWRKGRITMEELDSYCQQVTCSICEGKGVFDSYGVLTVCKTCDHTGKVQSKFIGLAEPIIPDIPFAGGSMGMGFPAAVGYALAKKLKQEDGKVYCFMSDGEQAIGTTWEAALIAAHHKLDNLVVIVDKNEFQAMGKVEEVLNIDPLQPKWTAFGWSTLTINGHDHTKIERAMLDSERIYTGQPCVFIANTIKGKGVSFMEKKNLYHYKQISDEEYQTALSELK